MISFSRVLQHVINTSVRSNLNHQCCKNVRNISTVKNLLSHDFRKKPENISLNAIQNTDADIFGTLNDNVELNDKLDSLPPEPDDFIQYDKDGLHKRLHIKEYHKIIQELINQHKV